MRSRVYWQFSHRLSCRCKH